MRFEALIHPGGVTVPMFYQHSLSQSNIPVRGVISTPSFNISHSVICQNERWLQLKKNISNTSKSSDPHHLKSSVGNQCAAICEIWKSLGQVRWGFRGAYCVPKVLGIIQTVHLSLSGRETKKEKVHRASSPQIHCSWQMEETIRSLKHTYCNWLHATARTFPTMDTVGMITPSVKLYQPQPNGKQLRIILQTNTERNL